MKVEVNSVNSLDPGLETKSIDTLLAGKSYRAIGSLGRGGMGEIYEVAHTVLKRHFALKVIQPRYAKYPHFVDRMRIEAQSAARLHHPHIVEVVDFWIGDDGRPCMVMELLEGCTLAREVALRRVLPVSEAVQFTLQLLSALRAIHDLGVVHRDIKPENLFLHHLPDRPRILKVLDFGVARVLPQASARAPLPPLQSTVMGSIVGTPRFASPEALRGESVDTRADIFSAGLILYFMLTGCSPYDRLLPTERPDRLRVRPVSEIAGPRVTPKLDAVILKAVCSNLDRRYQDAAEFARDLMGCSDTQRYPAGLVPTATHAKRSKSTRPGKA
jgi:eukaryotic-like serine/threonine-protein kinase